MSENGNGSDVKTVTLTIDGTEVTVPEGTNLVDAAHRVDVEVPHYCYHPGLSVPANCRICQVEIEGQPKLAFGCRTPVAEGMVVFTASEKARAHQQLVQEFLLSNHPLDCPICDKAGECTLQDYYMDYGRYTPVMIEDKYKKHKATPIGPTIVLDTERCILCSRCVRFCDEVTGTSELGLFHRNNHTEIGIVPGTELDNPYSGNLVDICPVGALGDRDFRFKARVWYLSETESVCPGCAKGCNIAVDHQHIRKPLATREGQTMHDGRRRAHKAKGARVMRLRPRHNGAVNGHWMCDEGRYSYAWHDVDRLEYAARRGAEGTLEPASVREALAEAAQAIRSAPGEWAVVLSTHLTTEDLWLAKRLFGEGLGVGALLVGPPAQGEADDLLRRADKSPNTAGAKALGLDVSDDIGAALGGKTKVWCVGHDLLGALGDAAPDLDTLVFQGTNTCASSMAATVALPAATCFEKDGTFVNEDGRVQLLTRAMLPLGDAETDLDLLRRLGESLGVGLPEGDAADVFDEMAKAESAFSGLSHESLGAHGAPLATEGAPA